MTSERESKIINDAMVSYHAIIRAQLRMVQTDAARIRLERLLDEIDVIGLKHCDCPETSEFYVDSVQ